MRTPVHPDTARAIGLGQRSQTTKTPAGLVYSVLGDALDMEGIPKVLRRIRDIVRQAQHECSATDRARPLAITARLISELANTIDDLDTL